MNVFVVSVCFFSVAMAAVGMVLPSDTLVPLPEIPVTSSRVQNALLQSKSIGIDTMAMKAFKTQSVADLLANYNYMMVRSYGPGNISLANLRGTSPNHTAVLWNGLNIQSQLHGQTDLSLIPAYFYPNTVLQFGGGSALFGSGAIGGALHLNSTSIVQPGLRVEAGTGYGSFQNIQPLAGIQYGNGRLGVSAKGFYTEAANNYPYYNDQLPGRPMVSQVNASFNNKGLLQELQYRINSQQHITIRYWGQQTLRHIPPTMFSTNKQDYQTDETHRIMGEWAYVNAAWYHAVRTLAADEKISYVWPTNEQFTNQARSYTTEYESKWSPQKAIDITAGAQYLHASARGDNLKSQAEIHRPAAFGSVQIRALQQRLSTTVSLRSQWNGITTTPLMPALNVSATLLKGTIVVRGIVSRNYRMPTFNDLYWRGAQAQGNPNLKPEEGWSFETGFLHKAQMARVTFNNRINAYQNTVTNWVYWRNNSDGLLQPDNLQSVAVQGLELQHEQEWHIFGKLRGSVLANYDYTEATIKNSNQPDLIGKQLIYVPYEKGFVQAALFYGNLYVAYLHAYTGFRYTREDNKAYLDAFSTGMVTVQYQWKYQKMKIQMFARGNNIWNENYQVMASRPMPLFNFQSGLYLSYQSK